ncbi:hybrid sensor histidine kinase/response regulator [Natronorubrum bangense]|uniref:histidine kinase n=2 Tax=Natronorubrum bangense TaxID=61858 RepID=L9WPI0_9EURY|nr:PAS domain S-box protein [Natronorubrum bangense]ELY51374.1 HTR-like protein [Natronorubrum bangense JCM 10635]QCC54651.1 PAS domain S-box protein [Natronorubrum bangense]
MTGQICCLVSEPSVQRALVESLTERLTDRSITAVSSPAQLCSRLEAAPIDGVVVGHDESDLDAVAVLERLRDRYPAVPVVVFPRDGSEALASAVLGAGGTDYVRRVDGYETLAARLERAVGGTATHAAPDCCAVLDSLDDAVIIYEPSDCAVVDVNERVCDLVGCRPQAACRCSLDTLRTGGVDDETVQSIVDRTLEDGTQQVEWQCQTADGEQFWAEITFKRVPRDGSPLVIALCNDISARKRRLHRLRSFQNAVDQAGHSIYITAPDGTIQYVNPAFEETTGYSADEAIGATPRLLRSGVHEQAFYQDLWRTILAGDVWDDQIVNRRKNGTEYTANQTIAPITDEDGDIVNFVAVNADISDQKRREAQLRQLHYAVREWIEATTREDVATRTISHLEELLEHELTAIFLYDPASAQLRPAAVSAAADELFETHPRFDEDEGIAWHVFETGSEAIYDDVRRAADAYNPETPIRSEIVLPLGDHGVLFVASQTVAAFDETDHTVLRIVASSLEATFDRICREQTLEQQRDRFEKFAHVVSHDLRNPLTVAMGELERARETTNDEAFDHVVQAHERIANIIDDLLLLAREGRAIDDRQPVSLADVASNAWDTVDAAGVSLELACDRRVLADPGRLQQLFENLFRNSVEHGLIRPDSHTRQDAVECDSTHSRPPADDTALTIRVGFMDDGFYVADTGVGIPDAERERILETGYTTADDGTGLGLSIVQTIVDSHGWSLEITDSETGGARFEIHSDVVD